MPPMPMKWMGPSLSGSFMGRTVWWRDRRCGIP
jgi:hypothetical protein